MEYTEDSKDGVLCDVEFLIVNSQDDGNIYLFAQPLMSIVDLLVAWTWSPTDSQHGSRPRHQPR